MVSKNDLFLAVLAMDAYNRGESPTLSVNANAGIGTATIKKPAYYDHLQSFSASGYSWTHDGRTSTVISYRGTDQFLPGEGSAGDIASGWQVAIGGTTNSQADLAIKAFQYYANGGVDFDVFGAPHSRRSVRPSFPSRPLLVPHVRLESIDE